MERPTRPLEVCLRSSIDDTIEYLSSNYPLYQTQSTSQVNPLSIVFFTILATALLVVQRDRAPIPLLMGTCYMTMGQGIEIIGLSFPVYRMLLAVGLVRVLTRGERIAGGFNVIDRLLLWWSAWVMFASLFHVWQPGSGPIFTASAVFNYTLSYFLIRIFCSTLDSTRSLIVVIAFILLPIAVEMISEQLIRKDIFAIFGGVPVDVNLRDGRFRAQGPFRHAILAGTVGATCFPLMLGIWSTHKRQSLIGMFACFSMVIASASSGPVISLAAAVGAALFWPLRRFTKHMRVCAVLFYLILFLIMAKPPYYLIARIKLVGGSTGYHRALLIDNTLKHFSEWWLFGTDVTRHWMPNQGAISATQTDITNYYISFGVLGGVISMGLLIAMFWRSFRGVGIVLKNRDLPERDQFMIWCFGATLFSHAVTSFSIAYFDQSVLFLWLAFAVNSSLITLLGDPVSFTDPEADLEPEPVMAV